MLAARQACPPVVPVAALGAVLGWRFRQPGHPHQGPVHGLTPLALSSLMRTTVSASETFQLGGGYLAGTFVLAGVAGGVARMPAFVVDGGGHLDHRHHGNFGLPVALAPGRQGSIQAVVIFVVSMVLMWTFGTALLASTPG